MDSLSVYSVCWRRDKCQGSWNRVICRATDGPRGCHTVKSEREKQVSHIKTHMWNLEKQYRWSYLQSRNWDTDLENKHMDTKGEWSGKDWEVGDWPVYTIGTMNKTDNKKIMRAMRTYCVPQGSLLTPCSDQNGEEIQETGDICLRIADSLCCTAETNTTL